MKMNQIYAVINKAQKQAWNKEAVSVIDTTSLIALGNHIINSSEATSKDLFTGALTDLISKTIFVSRALTGMDYGIYRDETDWGAVVRKVRVKPKGVEHNTEYDLASQEFDPFTMEIPTVLEQLYSKYTTYASEIVITDDQLFSAFKGDSELQAFYSLLFKQLEDSMYRAQISLDRLALANYIVEKKKLQATQTKKTHTINLIQEYYNEAGIITTTSKMWTDKEFLRFIASKLNEYKVLMNSDTDTFNASDGYVSQTPDEYLNFYVLNMLDSRLKTYLYADTFHEDFVKVSTFKTVPFWQGGIGSEGPAFKPTEISKIVLKPASTDALDEEPTITFTGVLAVMVDRDAIVSTYRNEKSESWRIPTKGTKHYRSKTHMYINDMLENGVVFYVEDIEEEETVPEG